MTDWIRAILITYYAVERASKSRLCFIRGHVKETAWVVLTTVVAVHAMAKSGRRSSGRGAPGVVLQPGTCICLSTLSLSSNLFSPDHHVRNRTHIGCVESSKRFVAKAHAVLTYVVPSLPMRFNLVLSRTNGIVPVLSIPVFPPVHSFAHPEIINRLPYGLHRSSAVRVVLFLQGNAYRH